MIAYARLLLVYLLLAAAVLFSAGCGTDRSGTTGTGDHTVSRILAPAAGDSLPYPIYTEFDEIAPLFTQNNDTIYVINFWATWCAPCVKEMPHFRELAREYADRPVKIVLVSLDFKKDVRTKLLQFVRREKLGIPVVALTDPNQSAWIDRVNPKWGGAIPVTVVYHKGARMFYEEAFATYPELRQTVEQFL